MKTIQVEDITKNIREMCIEANHFLTEDMKAAMEQACKEENPRSDSRCFRSLRTICRSQGRI